VREREHSKTKKIESDYHILKPETHIQAIGRAFTRPIEREEIKHSRIKNH